MSRSMTEGSGSGSGCDAWASVSPAGITKVGVSPVSTALATAARGTVPLSVWNMRFIAHTPAAAVRAFRSAPTKPGVIFASLRKSKSPDNLSFLERTFRIL